MRNISAAGVPVPVSPNGGEGTIQFYTFTDKTKYLQVILWKYNSSTKIIKGILNI